ncbi:hypothetical protein [Saccharopolyspora sp. ASAGF58]|uniref:hypothetical protein n=1 Tax=Saccharopolyspora TaxID=1835 RepID=UPI001440185E|nr:hypothetical protein [Saccharopolyspora sp. ASAGF58]QIZ36311.1 hypothetical protein FDZ84_18555 [Saccharopolyspora sp. ASAGF58]
MTQPGGLGPEEQKELVDSLATLVRETAPEAWQRISIEYKCIGRHVELGVGCKNAAGEQIAWELPTETDTIFWRLRVGMYREGLGTWFSAFFRMRQPGEYEIFYNHDNEPPWGAEPGSFIKEQDLFPRDDEHTPDWFRRRLAEASST